MKTNIKTGLTNMQVKENYAKYGKNTITQHKNEGFFKKLLESLGDPIIKILIIALGIKVVFLIHSFDWYETVGILIAIFLASLISTTSEYGSIKAFKRLQEESSRIKCKVRRDGDLKEIFIEDVVVEDIILLESGDKIPADGIIVEGDISVDESSLNGESKEVYKNAYHYGEIKKHHQVYRGCVVYSGVALMLVQRIGNDTIYGKIAFETSEKQPDSPMKVRLQRLAKLISNIGYICAIFVGISYLFSVIVIDNHFDINLIRQMFNDTALITRHLLYALTLSVTILIVAVPEGLPMMITLVLSSNMKKMLKNNVLVRKMIGIETAGSLNILFTDKTGTLTKGKLEVTGVMSAEGNIYQTENELLKHKNYHTIVRESLVYNNASSYDKDNNIIGGNTTDRAILDFIKTKGSTQYLKTEIVSFDSKNKYSSCVIEKDMGVRLIKGAPEKILPDCRHYINEQGVKKVLLHKDQLSRDVDMMTKRGIRVIALALNDKNSKSMTRLSLVGLVFIKDEIRKEAIEGVKLVHQAHIQTVMITGDNKDTALSIAKEVNIYKEGDLVLTSEELSKKTDEELKKIIPNLRIVARALPQDKSRLVRLSQELGLVVGMTGDGVNDAPALKKADVGFAMGSGTEVSKEAADIVILDDNFLSISKAILFGRTIFKSIRKFIIFQLTINLCAVSLSIIGPFIGVDTPVTVIQMLWINMVMDTLAGIAFAYEPPLLEYMKEKPKKRDEPIINKYMLNEILFTGAFSSLLCIWFLTSSFTKGLFRTDITDQYFMTAFFGLFIFIGIFNCFNARTARLNLTAYLSKNKAFIITITFILFVQLALIYYGGTVFRTSGLTLFELIIMMIIASLVIPIDWFRKIMLRKKGIFGGV